MKVTVRSRYITAPGDTVEVELAEGESLVGVNLVGASGWQIITAKPSEAA